MESQIRTTEPAAGRAAFDRATFDAALAAAGVPALRGGELDMNNAGLVRLTATGVADGAELFLGGVTEAVTDDCVTLPPVSVGDDVVTTVDGVTREISRRLGMRGPVDVRYALVNGVLHGVRGSAGVARTLPFVAAATAVPLVEAANRVLHGSRIAALRAEGLLPARGSGCGPAAGASSITVRCAGVTAVDSSFGRALARCQLASGRALPTGGTLLVLATGAALRAILWPVRRLAALGFRVVADAQTTPLLWRNDIPAVAGSGAGYRDAQLVIDLTSGADTGAATRLTSVAGTYAAALAIEALVTWRGKEN